MIFSELQLSVEQERRLAGLSIKKLPSSRLGCMFFHPKSLHVSSLGFKALGTWLSYKLMQTFEKSLKNLNALYLISNLLFEW